MYKVDTVDDRLVLFPGEVYLDAAREKPSHGAIVLPSPDPQETLRDSVGPDTG